MSRDSAKSAFLMMKFEKAIPITVAAKAIDVLAEQTRHANVSRARLKKVMNQGAVWLKDARGERRLRRASHSLKAGDTLTLYYDADIVDREPEPPSCIACFADYSVWYKPVGLLAQGTRYGDHCSLLRQVELALAGDNGMPVSNVPGMLKVKPPQVFLVHRLDRETDGVMLVAHNKRAAALLSDLFQQRRISKFYRAWVLGEVREALHLQGQLDGKAAETKVTPLAWQPDRTLLAVSISTGRKHQIRRHLADAGFPVLGDPRYGQGNACADGLQLSAVELRFRCPFTRLERSFQVPEAFQQCGVASPQADG